jgi:hypothetical protein
MSTPASPPVVDELRQRISRLAGASTHGRSVLPFGIEVIDRVLPGGGLPLGALHEVAGGGNGAIDGAAAALFTAGVAARTAGKVLWCLTRQDLFAPALGMARLPAIYPEREYADDGGLMTYGTNIPDSFRRAAGYVDRILHGAKPGDLPIDEPAKFDFVVNLRTARALGVAISPDFLSTANEVIE